MVLWGKFFNLIAWTGEIFQLSGYLRIDTGEEQCYHWTVKWSQRKSWGRNIHTYQLSIRTWWCQNRDSPQTDDYLLVKVTNHTTESVRGKGFLRCQAGVRTKVRFKNIGLNHVGKQRPKLVSAENKINRYHLINPVLTRSLFLYQK